MRRLIKTLSTGAEVYYDNGQFDEWCVYVDDHKNAAFAPRDIQYFTTLQQLAAKHTAARLYQDFVAVYDATDRQVRPPTLALIDEISARYGTDSATVEYTLTVIYAGMVAEQNKAYAVLGKRVKRLGVYQVLMLGMPPSEAANFSKGKKARQVLAPLCQSYGF